MDIRLHGRGGQGGVTCAKILAAVYSKLGKSVQAFGDYASERSGAPVRAYTRVGDKPITNRNKVYEPDHLLVLDSHLLGAEVVTGLAPGGSLLVNTPQSPEELALRFPRFRIATVDATAIARRAGIGTRTVVIVNTTLAGAFMKVHGIPFEALEGAYRNLGFLSNLPAAWEAYEAVQVREPGGAGHGSRQEPAAAAGRVEVLPLTEHTRSGPTGLRTGSWSTQRPRYVEHLAPCVAWCPAGNDVVGFIQALACDGIDAAARLLGQSNPLAGVCGHVCPAPCMEGCNRAEYDGAVNIRGIEREIADAVRVAARDGGSPPRRRHLAVVGGGPAGLSAAYAAARAGHRVTIYDAEEGLGGLLRTGIPSYRLPRGVVEREVSAILDLGVEARCGARLGPGDVVDLVAEHDAVILATGLQRQRSLDLSGSALGGIVQGLDFLRGLNAGGEVGVGRGVVVLGGGNTAMDCARSALRSGAASVTVAYRRTRAEMPAIAEEIEQAKEEGVRFAFQLQPVAFHGVGAVEAIEVAEVEMGEPDETGRRSPVVTDRTRKIPCDMVLLALGQSAELALLPSGWALRDGRAFEGGSPLMCFAAGDFCTGEGTVTHAVGSGRRAAGLALDALGEPVEVFTRPSKGEAVPVTDIRCDHFARAPAAQERLMPLPERLHGFDLVSSGIDARRESHRCFSCGHCTQCDTCLVYCPEGSVLRRTAGYEVDYSYCKGCGICATECPRAGMEMVDL